MPVQQYITGCLEIKCQFLCHSHAYTPIPTPLPTSKIFISLTEIFLKFEKVPRIIISDLCTRQSKN